MVPVDKNEQASYSGGFQGANMSSTSLQPLSDRVLVRRDDAETTTPSGLVIPQNAQTEQSRGVVLATGPGRRQENGELATMNVTVGDRVLFGKYAGTVVRHDNEDLVILREDDLLGVFQ